MALVPIITPTLEDLRIESRGFLREVRGKVNCIVGDSRRFKQPKQKKNGNALAKHNYHNIHLVSSLLVVGCIYIFAALH
jgi:hypothetical protein